MCWYSVICVQREENLARHKAGTKMRVQNSPFVQIYVPVINFCANLLNSFSLHERELQYKCKHIMVGQKLRVSGACAFIVIVYIIFILDSRFIVSNCAAYKPIDSEINRSFIE